jgi:hypothetical protein
MMSFNLFVRAEVSSVADGKRIKTKMLLRDQPTGLEFTDAGCVIEFLCPPGRPFSVGGTGATTATMTTMTTRLIPIRRTATRWSWSMPTDERRPGP